MKSTTYNSVVNFELVQVAGSILGTVITNSFQPIKPPSLHPLAGYIQIIPGLNPHQNSAAEYYIFNSQQNVCTMHKYLFVYIQLNLMMMMYGIWKDESNILFE